MPEIIKEHKFGRLTRAAAYDEYLDGQIYKWSKDELEEYSNGAATVRSGVYSAARRQDKRVRSQVLEDGSLVLQVYEEDEEA